MIQPFGIAMRHVLDAEGLYSVDPDDPGGETYRGISRRAHPDWPGWQEIDAAKEAHETSRAFTSWLASQSHLLESAIRLYHEAYWKRIHAEHLPPLMAIALFDWAVNARMETAVRSFQRLIGRVRVDGIMGPKTSARAREVAAIHYEEDGYYANKLCEVRIRFYVRLVQQRPAKAKWLWGWIRRVLGIMQIVREVECSAARRATAVG